MGIVENIALKDISQFSNISKIVWKTWNKDPNLKIRLHNSNTLGNWHPSVKPNTIAHDHIK